MWTRVAFVLILAVMLQIVMQGCKDRGKVELVDSQEEPSWPKVCLDGTVCQDGKSCVIGDCIVLCGDDQCARIFGESCYTCPEDCGTCCGNGICDVGEPDGGCPGDCEGLEEPDEFQVTDGFVFIKSGSFWMGCPDGGDCPLGYSGAGCKGDGTGEMKEDEHCYNRLHHVAFTNGLEMQVNEVTQVEWKEIFNGWNPSSFPMCGDDCPIESVSWYDALAFANRMSEQAGLDPCYSFSNVECEQGGNPADDTNYTFCLDAVHGGIDSALTNFSGNTYRPNECVGYRLPTEAEWEYAVRAGTLTAFYNGQEYDADLDDCDKLYFSTDIAWYCANNTPEGPKPVGGKVPNSWGLKDMAGNVEEWCWDRHSSEYDFCGTSQACSFCGTDGACDETENIHIDPVKYNDDDVVVRGGDWNSMPYSCRSDARHASTPGDRYNDRGFRLVRSKVSARCGDGVCGSPGLEDCTTCPEDCGNCCSNGICDLSETCCNCPDDCGSCSENGVCDCGEAKATHPEDCPANVTDEFVRIPAGSFWMGCPDGGDCPLGYTGAGCKGDGTGKMVKDPSCGGSIGYLSLVAPLHHVTLTHDFEMQINEVTQGEWKEAFDGKNPSHHSCGDNYPVESVVYRKDVLEFANWKSEQAGLEPCYILTGDHYEPALFPPGVDTPYGCEGYRLPTEAEWEYAARAGSTTIFYPSEGNNGKVLTTACGDANMDQIGWFLFNTYLPTSSAPYPSYCSCSEYCATRPVGLKEPNAWGLKDMLGNVAEWCWDKSCNYDLEDSVNPWAEKCIQNTSQYDHAAWVTRGGSFSWWGSCYYRDYLPLHPKTPSSTRYEAKYITGFRLARTLHK